MKLECLGCGREVNFPKGAIIAYTCPCEATIFYDPDTKMLSPPASLLRVLSAGKELPHIDYYLGKSNHWSPLKQIIYDLLREHGAIWSWECEECRGKVVQRCRAERFYPLEFHVELQKLIEV